MIALPKGTSHVMEKKNHKSMQTRETEDDSKSNVGCYDRADSSYKLSNRAVAFSCKICHAALTCLTSVNGAPTAKRRMYSPDRTCTHCLSSRGRTYYIGDKQNKTQKLIYAYRVCYENTSR